MTDHPEPQTPPPAAPGRRRWLMPVLVASLALNLAVAGLVAGAIIRGGPPMRGDMMGDSRRDMGRDMGLGLLSEGLSRGDRLALRRALVAADPDIGDWRARAGEEFGAVIAALRAEPFDPAALGAVMQAQSGRMQARLDTGRRILIERIAAMSPGERAEFATRLEERVGRFAGGKGRD